jgi:hypothetical protein
MMQDDESKDEVEDDILELTKVKVIADNPNTTQALEYTKDKYNVKIIK